MHTTHHTTIKTATCSCLLLRRGVAAQLGKESGARTKWSAPLLFTVNAAGAGATLGVTEIASVLVLDTPEACSAFLRTQVCARLDCNVCSGTCKCSTATQPNCPYSIPVRGVLTVFCIPAFAPLHKCMQQLDWQLHAALSIEMFLSCCKRPNSLYTCVQTFANFCFCFCCSQLCHCVLADGVCPRRAPTPELLQQHF